MTNDDGVSVFESVRPRLFGIAYRMLGSAAEAEDIVQDAWLRWQGSTESNARQLVTRARKHISDGRRKAVSSSQQKRLLNAFIVASQKGDLPALEKLFASDVVSYADGGGAVHVARLPVSGRDRVANYFASVGSFMGTGVTIEWIETNGQAGALVLRNGAAIGLATIEASEEGIFRILLIMRPSKLVAISRSRSIGTPAASESLESIGPRRTGTRARRQAR